MTASDAEAFHRAAVERWKQEPDAIEKLVIKLGWLHLEKAEAILRAKAVEAERDAAEQRAQAAESREAALRQFVQRVVDTDVPTGQEGLAIIGIRAAGHALLRAAEGGERDD